VTAQENVPEIATEGTTFTEKLQTGQAIEKQKTEESTTVDNPTDETHAEVAYEEETSIFESAVPEEETTPQETELSTAEIEANVADVLTDNNKKIVANREDVLSDKAVVSYEKSAVQFSKDSEKVVYDNVLTDNIAIEYAPSFDGIKENIVLQQYEGINVFHFVINTSGLIPQRLYAESAAIPLVRAGSDETVLYISPIDARDSLHGTEADNGGHYSLDHSMRLTPTGQNGEYILTIIADQAFLENDDGLSCNN
jgi:hypothetical protein